MNIRELLKEIKVMPPDWHGAGTMSNVVLDAIARHADLVGEINHSAETGSGKTTLLFSHLSKNHTTFAINDGDSIARVQSSPLFESRNVTYVLGPSQLTLPRHVFNAKLQIALIDGPHGYPFPDLEYYYFYPQISTGGLLLIDDINIPSIKSMFEIVKADEMFELLEVVEYTAFFRRTNAPLVDPLGDCWTLQGFNREHYEYAMARSQGSSSSGFRRLRGLVPSQFKRMIPLKWKTAFLRKF